MNELFKLVEIYKITRSILHNFGPTIYELDVKRLNEQKGIDVLIEALNKIKCILEENQK